jgi:sulfur dioxygenase
MELRKHLDGTDRPFVLDVREPIELQGELGRIEGAKNIPITKLVSYSQELSDLKDKEIVLICRSGSRATTGAQILKQMGFKRPIVLRGGMIAWRAILNDTLAN